MIIAQTAQNHLLGRSLGAQCFIRCERGWRDRTRIMPTLGMTEWWNREGAADWEWESVDDNSLCTQLELESRLIEITHCEVALRGLECGGRETREGFGSQEQAEYLKQQSGNSLKTCKHWEDREPRIKHWAYQYHMFREAGGKPESFYFFPKQRRNRWRKNIS